MTTQTNRLTSQPVSRSVVLEVLLPLSCVLATSCVSATQATFQALRTAHEANNALFQIVRQVNEEQVADNREQVVRRYEEELREYAQCLREHEDRSECNDPGSPEDWLQRWQHSMERVRHAEDAVYATDDAIVDLSIALDAWEESGDREMPENVRAGCGALARSLTDTIEILRDFDVDVPDGFDHAVDVLGSVCAWSPAIVGMLTQGGES